jgi:hypothetical protein
VHAKELRKHAKQAPQDYDAAAQESFVVDSKHAPAANTDRGVILKTKFLGREAMTRIVDRRGMLRIVLGVAAAAAMGLTLVPETAEAAPLELGLDRAAPAENLVEEAAWVRRRRVCWWRHGRRVCRWRRERCWWRHGHRVCRVL